MLIQTISVIKIQPTKWSSQYARDLAGSFKRTSKLYIGSWIISLIDDENFFICSDGFNDDIKEKADKFLLISWVIWL